ncbi:hypothetical protein [uncultured Hymenobacter sp.]|uniref:hypothetical protein n=1 Tax=uncultured Hymenobacter sp. TaxID=170016 RepID=UPI0035CAC898
MRQVARVFDVLNHQVLVTAIEGTAPCACRRCKRLDKVPLLRITTHIYHNHEQAQLVMDIPCPDESQQRMALHKFAAYHAARAFSVLQEALHLLNAQLYLQIEIEALGLELFGLHLFGLDSN